MKLIVLALTAFFLFASPSPARPVPRPAAFAASCAAIVPATIRGASAQWLGACIGGKADGVGILRVGSRQPFAFLVGHMKGGKPESGLVFRPNGGYQQAMAFDASGDAIIADGEHMREQDAVWADAVRAARSVAARFAATGNHASAAYYRGFATRIADGRPD